MKDIANELSLMVCRQQIKGNGESDIDFSTRLFDVYISCYKNLEDLIEQENQPLLDESVQNFLHGK